MLLCVSPIDCATLRMNPNVNYGLWAITICQLGSSIVTNATSWGGILLMGEVMHMQGQGFAVNLKPLLKNTQALGRTSNISVSVGM